MFDFDVRDRGGHGRTATGPRSWSRAAQEGAREGARAGSTRGLNPREDAWAEERARAAKFLESVLGTSQRSRRRQGAGVMW